LQKNSDDSKYGVWKIKPYNEGANWISGNKGNYIKNVDLGAANRELNDRCNTSEYQPTD
jgi:hypothetical protein